VKTYQTVSSKYLAQGYDPDAKIVIDTGFGSGRPLGLNYQSHGELPLPEKFDTAASSLRNSSVGFTKRIMVLNDPVLPSKRVTTQNPSKISEYQEFPDASTPINVRCNRAGSTALSGVYPETVYSTIHRANP
jgi:hypothetical protein